MNLILLTSIYFKGRFDGFTLQLTLACLPAMILGILVGDYYSKRLNDKAFRTIVFSLLFVAGVFFIN